MRNILRLVKQDEKNGEVELEKYAPGAPAIKVSLGFVRTFLSPPSLIRSYMPVCSTVRGSVPGQRRHRA